MGYQAEGAIWLGDPSERKPKDRAEMIKLSLTSASLEESAQLSVQEDRAHGESRPGNSNQGGRCDRETTEAHWDLVVHDYTDRLIVKSQRSECR